LWVLSSTIAGASPCQSIDGIYRAKTNELHVAVNEYTELQI
jgi:hypothetical protein